MGAVTDILGSALPLPTDLGAVTNVLDDPLGAVQTDILGAVPSALGDLLNATDALGALTAALPSATDILGDALAPLVTDILANPAGALTDALAPLATDVLANPLATGLLTNPLGALTDALAPLRTDVLANPLPTDALAPLATDVLANPLGAVGNLLPPVPTAATNPLGGLLPPGPAPVANPLGGLVGGVLAPTGTTKPLGALGNLLGGGAPAANSAVSNLLGAVSSAVAPAATGGLQPPVTNPRIPRVIQSGTIVDKSYNWTFYNNGAVQVDRNFLFPRQGVLSGLLPDRTFSGLFADGLHIGDHIVPFPLAFLPLLAGLKLPLAPPSLLSGVDVDDDDARK